jgi:hypothetical protein
MFCDIFCVSVTNLIFFFLKKKKKEKKSGDYIKFLPF